MAIRIIVDQNIVFCLSLTALNPGEEIELSITARSPESGGDYRLEIDTVQEGVSWFKEKGNEAALVPVEVAGPSSLGYRKRIKKLLSGLRSKMSVWSGPNSELHGILAADVIEVIEVNGGQVVAMQYDESVGRNKSGYFYFVTK